MFGVAEECRAPDHNIISSSPTVDKVFVFFGQINSGKRNILQLTFIYLFIHFNCRYETCDAL